MKLLNTVQVLAQARAMRAAEDWLRAHPRGHIELLPDERGFIVHCVSFDLESADTKADCTAVGDTLADALASAMEAE